MTQLIQTALNPASHGIVGNNPNSPTSSERGHFAGPGNGPAAASATPQRQQATAMVEHALGWLQGDHRDPGCPSHGPRA